MSDRTRNLNQVLVSPFKDTLGEQDKVWKGRQRTVSTGHRRNPRTGKYEEGGPFYSYRISSKINPTHINVQGPKGQKYSGPAWVSLVPGLGSLPQDPSTDSSGLDYYGAMAVSILDPANPNAETGVALGEVIRDRSIPIPGIQAWKRRTEVAKAAASEYLNAVFGWLPLVNDMKNTAQSVKDGNVILENYHRSSGSNIRREFAFDDIITEDSSVIGRTIPEYWGPSLTKIHSVGDVTRHTKTVTKRWFSGAFTYKANSSGSAFRACLDKTSDANKLFGASLTPDLVWELTPWSWAIDWFSNAQEVIHNISSFTQAGLVMRYGYIMEESTTIETYTMPSDCFRGYQIALPPCTRTISTKRRREANPFGFGIKWEGLTPTQLAISAALGITRLL